nr:phage portal protein [uncultured Caproiciproducens sp.]
MQSLTIDFNDINQLRQIIQNYMYSENCAYLRMKAQAEDGFKYYDNEGLIKKNGAAYIYEVNSFMKKIGKSPLHSADNRISMNRHRVVVDQKIGYLFSVPPQFDLPADDAGKGDDPTLKKVNDTVGSQWPKVIKQLGTDASNCGRAWLAFWQEDNGFDYWYVNPLTCVPIYDRSTVKKKLLYLLRAYGYNDQNGKPVTRYEIWGDSQVAYLIKPEAQGSAKPIINYETLPDGSCNIQPHNYGRVPFIEFRNNAKAFNDLIMYKDIIDALDKLVSGFANDCDDIQEVLWVLKNYSGESEVPVYNKDGTEAVDDNGEPIMRPVDVPQMLKLKKFVTVGDNGGVDKITNEIPFQARQAFRDILNEEFWTSAMAVNPNPPSSTGNQSGVYIDYLYGLLELKGGLMETEFRDSIDEFLETVLHYLGVEKSKQFVQTWKRTKPQNNTETATILSTLPDTVMSNETKTKNAPFVNDWQAERAQIEKEQKQNEQNLLDSMGQPGHEHPPGSGNKPPQPNADDGGGT